MDFELALGFVLIAVTIAVHVFGVVLMGKALEWLAQKSAPACRISR